MYGIDIIEGQAAIHLPGERVGVAVYAIKADGRISIDIDNPGLAAEMIEDIRRGEVPLYLNLSYGVVKREGNNV